MQYLHLPPIQDITSYGKQALEKGKSSLSFNPFTKDSRSRSISEETAEAAAVLRAPTPDSRLGLDSKQSRQQTTVRGERIQPKVWLYQSYYSAKYKMEGLAGMVGKFGPQRVTFGAEALPIHLFGKVFEATLQQEESKDEATGNEHGSSEFMRNFRALIWFTYRRNFVPMQPPSSYTSDTGWGCMLRSAQMILSQMLQRHMIGQEAWEKSNIESDLKERKRQLLRWFVDAPKLGALYSIHRMTQCGVRYGKQPGEWYGPTTAALVLRDLVQAHGMRGQNEMYSSQSTKQGEDTDTLVSPSGQKVAMVVSDDGTIYINEILAMCEVPRKGKDECVSDPLLQTGSTDTQQPKWHTAVFILLPLRLGLEKLNEDYLKPLTTALKIKECVGMIGGKPAHSLYFVGSQGDNLIYLDPHTVQPAAVERTVRAAGLSAGSEQEASDANGDHQGGAQKETPRCEDAVSKCSENVDATDSVLPGEYILPSDDDLATYCCSDPKVMPVKDIDPSLAIGFYCSSRQQFYSLCNRIAELKAVGLPILNTMLDRPNYACFGDDESDGLGMESDDLQCEDSDGECFHDAVSGDVTSPTLAKTSSSPKSIDSVPKEDDFVLL